ncbi:MAG: energy transducer TonB [Gammaproteobacteria bacterium]|nr:energy transducer TonB [Gammaproteobacteria bacterium]
MKLLNFSHSPWFMAVSLHLGLLALLINWPDFYHLRSLPQSDASLSAYILPSAISPAAKTHMSHTVKPIQAARPVTQVHQIQAQQVASPQLQILLRSLAQDISQHLVYPDLAKSHIQQGSSIIGFTLQPNGVISTIQIDQSSGVADLDRAAINAIQACSPFSMPIVISQAIHLSLPVDFSLH